MSQVSSAGIVTTGLVFAYDMNNRKSYTGEPSTNYVTDAATMAGWGVYDNGNDGTFLTEFGTTGYRMNARGSWNGLLKGISLPSTGTYTLSAYIRYWGGTANNNGATVYCSGWGGGDVAAGIDKSIIGQWQRISLTVNATNLSFTFFLISYGGTYGGDNVTWEVTMPQVNAGSYATAFTNASRVNTQAIVDLTGNNVLTANSLTYASDGTFSFTYSNPSYLTIPLATAFNKTEGTMNFWVYPTRYNGGNGYFVNREDSAANAVDWFWIGPYSDTFYFRLGNGSDCCSNDLSFGSVSSVIPLNTWTNMCFSWKANGTSAIYKNGVLYTSRSIGNVPSTNPAANGRIGLGHGNADDYFNGRMPLVQIYSRQLSATEVLQNFNALRGRYGI